MKAPPAPMPSPDTNAPTGRSGDRGSATEISPPPYAPIPPPVPRRGADVGVPPPLPPEYRPGPSQDASPAGPRSRYRALTLVIVVAILSAVVSWVAATRMTSPEEARRSRREPQASLVTVPVERRVLESELVLRGRFESTDEIVVTAPNRKASAGPVVVTKELPGVGTQVVEGQVLAEMSGRPLIVLRGTLPAYRDITFGARGDDVRQLEDGISRLGIDPGPVDGVFDEGTQVAVEALFARAGYLPPEPDADQAARVDTERAAVAAATTSVRESEANLARAGSPKASELIRLATDVSAAERVLDAARLNAAQARQKAPNDVAQAQADLDLAASQQRSSENAASAARTPGAVNPTTGEPYGIVELSELDAAVTTAKAEVSARTRALAAARSNALTLVLEADKAVLDAQDALTLAVASYQEARSPATGPESAALQDARSTLADAKDRLLAAERASDGIPMAELLFVSDLPLQVSEVALRRGDVATGKILVLSGSVQRLRSLVSAADLPNVQVGAEVTAFDAELDLTIKGVVSSVSSSPEAATSTSDTSKPRDGGSPDASRFPVLIAPRDLPPAVDPASLRGVNFRVTIATTTTSGAVLAVPVAALSSAVDGSTSVQVLPQSGSPKVVKVTRGLAADGLVEVRPLTEGELNEGDAVVVGR